MREVDRIFNSMLGGSSPYTFVDHLYTEDGAILTDFQVNYAQDFTFIVRKVNTTNNDIVGVHESAWTRVALSFAGMRLIFYTGSVSSLITGDSNRTKIESVVSGANRINTFSRLVGDTWSQVSTFTVTNPTSTPPSLYFAAIGLNNRGTLNRILYAFEMYQIVISEGGVTIHDLRPAVRRADNVAGLLDIITGTFYPPTAGTITAV